jgi:cyclin-dependent kinase 9
MSSVYALRFHIVGNTCLQQNYINSGKTENTMQSNGKCEENRFKYKIMTKIGEGTFGQVFQAEHINTCKVVAIKKIMNNCRSDDYIENEIKLLQMMKHKNIIKLIEIFSINNSSKDLIQYLVFEFCDYDLCELLYNTKIQFSFGEIKNILYQVFEGLSYIHQSAVLHRDLKPANILISKTGLVRIADFGLAKSLCSYPPNGFSSKVVTLAYRPPELLLGHRFYGTSVDMWSVGCIMAEFWTKTPIFPGIDDHQQLLLISQLCGPINSTTLLGLDKFYYLSDLYLPQLYPRRVKQMFINELIDDSNAADLFDRLLCINPTKRISARSALEHSFFISDPKPCDISKTLQKHNKRLVYFLEETETII